MSDENDTEDLDALAEHVNHLQNRINRLKHFYGGNHDQKTHGKRGAGTGRKSSGTGKKKPGLLGRIGRTLFAPEIRAGKSIAQLLRRKRKTGSFSPKGSKNANRAKRLKILRKWAADGGGPPSILIRKKLKKT